VSQTHQLGILIMLRFSLQDKLMLNLNLMPLLSLKVDINQLGMVNGVTIDMLFSLLQEDMKSMLMLDTTLPFTVLVNLLWTHPWEMSWYKTVISTSLEELLQTSGEELRTSRSHQLLEPQCFGLYLKLPH
jgi:hypothetical protein